MRTETPVPVQLSAYTPYPFEISRIALDFALDADTTRVTSRMEVRRLGEGDMVLDGTGLELISLEIDGTALEGGAYTLTPDALTLHGVPDAFTLKIVVENRPLKNTALSGLYVSGGRLCTQCEADGFRRITYWPDRPDVMSRFHVRLEGDQAAFPFLLSNGTPGAAGALSGGRHFAEWDDPHPKPSYLFALCAGDYDVYRDSFTTASGREVQLGIHVDKGDAERAAYAMDALKRSMVWDEQVFGREYDLGVFNIVAVRDFNFGAMENKGLNVFNSAYVLADEQTATDSDFEAIESIVAHEYFHNWTGNRITCRDWFQLCLKEGLTVFRDQEFSADMRSRPVQRIKDVIRLRSRQFAEDSGPLAHAVRPAEYSSVDNLYTATVYEKGAELIRMLKALIGEAAFARGMALYFERFDGHAATIEDFYSCFGEASGQDLSHFMVWYSQPGTPTLRVDHTYDAETGRGQIALKQFNPVTRVVADPQPLPMPLSWALLDGQGGAHIPEGADGTEHVHVLDAATGSISYVLSPGTPKPLVSINRGFSASVHLSENASEDEARARVRWETDPFRRWDTLQSVLMADLLAMAYDHKPSPDAELVADLAETVMAAREDPAYAALLARLPGVNDLFQAHTPADPARLDWARKAMNTALADALSDLRNEVLSAPTPAPYAPSAEQAGIRALRGAMIALSAHDKSDASASRLEALFAHATNMTEQLACLSAIGQLQGTSAPAFAAFFDQWSKVPTVVDKWFQVCALNAPDAQAATALTRHADFDLGNPNRVRAVAGVFAMQNLAAFHAEDGSGYRFLAELAQRADARNPALAARLLQAFEQWRSLTPGPRDAAHEVLEALSKSGLSRNAGDIVSRALGEAASAG